MSTDTPAIKSRGIPSIFLSGATDTATENDTLGFKPYVESIARFLESPSTKPPIAISIEGEWGSGKSSFMKQLRIRLCGLPRSALFAKIISADREKGVSRVASFVHARREASQHRSVISIEFNAWRHDKEDSLWAAFAHQCTKELRQSQRPLKQLTGASKLLVSRLNGVSGFLEALRFLFVLTIWLACLTVIPIAIYFHGPDWADTVIQSVAKASSSTNHNQASTHRSEVASIQERKSPEPAAGSTATKEGEEHGNQQRDAIAAALKLSTYGGAIGAWGGLIVLISPYLLKLGNPLEAKLEKIRHDPNYQQRISFVEQFHKDFHEILDAYVGRRRVYVFVDDLDRCEVPKAADTMQAINLMIDDDPRLVFIIGMDRQKVAAGIAAKYHEVFEYLPQTEESKLTFGYEYLDKFIQLAYRIPQPRKANLQVFLRDLARHPADASQHWIRVLLARSAKKPTAPQVPDPTDPTDNQDDTDAQSIDRRAVQLRLENESGDVRRVATMVAAVFQYNPRRIKQFLNLFRLSALIANEMGLFDEVNNRPLLTFEQLGKFVALSMRWRDMASLLLRDESWLRDRYRSALATNAFNISPDIRELLRFGCKNSPTEDVDSERYDLDHLPIEALLSITTPIVRAQIPQPSLAQEPEAGSKEVQTSRDATMESISAKDAVSSLEGLPAEEISKIGNEYVELRKQLPGGKERTAMMTALVHRTREIAKRIPPDFAQALFSKGDPGSRIVAIGLAQGNPQISQLGVSLEGIRHSQSPFEQFHALTLCERLIDAMGMEEARMVTDALNDPDVIRLINDDSSRRSLRERILSKLEKKQGMRSA